MKTILVTGAAGFIGCNLVRRLLTKHGAYDVIALDLCTYAGDKKNLGDCCGDAMFEFIKGDICDESLVDSIMCDADIVINLAAYTDVDRSIESGADFVRSNIDGVRVLAESALRHNIKKFIQVSTDEVYGPLEQGFAAEDSPLRADNPYSATKAGGDLLALAYHNTFALPVVIVRPSSTYGPFQHPEKMIPLCITHLLENRRVPVYGDGRHMRNWMHVDDHCAGLIAAMERGTPGGVYNLSADMELANIDLSKKILTLFGKDESMIEFIQDRPGHDRRHAGIAEKAKRDLGWNPEVDFEQGLTKTIEWYRQNAQWWQSRQRQMTAG